jgi:hypothetical protein
VIGRRTRTAESVFERAWSRTVTLVVGLTLIGAVSAPTASAGLAEKAADTVASTVKSVQAGANGAPSPPSATPPVSPPVSPPGPPPKPAPAATPAPPPPQAPVKPPPSRGPSPSPPRAGTGSAEPPSADGVPGAAQHAAGAVAGVGEEAASRAATTSERSGGGRAAAPQRRVDPAAGEHRAEGGSSEPRTEAGSSEHRAEAGSSEPIVRRSRTTSSPSVALRPAEVATLQRWLARVWPAIALGGGATNNGTEAVEAIAGSLLRPVLAVVAGALLVSSPIPPTSDGAPLAGHHGVAGASRPAPNSAPVPAAPQGGGVLYLILMVGLLALLAFTVWREFHVALHPHSH